MRPQKVDDTVLINNLMNVIRAKGYDGASLNELATASGLQKASLYHRFPGGKKDIVRSVIHHISDWSQKNIVAIIQNTGINPEEKLTRIIHNLDTFYAGGQNACILKTLSMDNSFHLFGDELKQGAITWMESFTELAQLFNHNQKQATIIAQEVVIQIQGSLVLAKTLGNDAVFKNALQNIINLYKN